MTDASSSLPWLIQAETIWALDKERHRQHRKWGEQDHEDRDWRSIMGEEIGEVDKAMVEFRFNNGEESEIRKELIETIAVAIAWLEAMDRRDDGSSTYRTVADTGKKLV